MKKIFRLAGVAWLAVLMNFVFSPKAFATLYDEQGRPLPEIPQESPYDAVLKKMLSRETASEDSNPEMPASDDVVSADDGGGSAIDELMKSLLRPGETDVPQEPGAPPFDGTPWGLEGSWFVVQEGSGNLSPGRISRVRLIALRRSDGIYDRALALEIAPVGEDPFLIRLSDDVKGFESRFDLQNFRTSDRSEIVLSVRGSGEGLGRLLIVGADNRRGDILYDSETVKVPSVRGRFFDDWRAEIVVEDTDSHTLIDLAARKGIYERNRIYNEGTGTLRSVINIWTSKYLKLQPADIDDDGICELQSVFELSGAGRADRIAYVDATLKHRDGKWQVADCWVAPAEDLRMLPLPVRIR